MLLLPSALAFYALCRIAVTKSKEHTPGDRMSSSDHRIHKLLKFWAFPLIDYWCCGKCQVLHENFMSLGIFTLSQNIWRIIDVLGNLLIIFPFILLCLWSLLKCFWSVWFPLAFFLWVQIQLYIANAIFLGSTMNFFVVLLTWEFILGNFVSYDFHSVQSFKHLMLFLLEKQEENPPLLQMGCKGHLKNQQLPNDVLQVSRLYL